jgi:hypothetical protein
MAWYQIRRRSSGASSRKRWKEVAIFVIGLMACIEFSEVNESLGCIRGKGRGDFIFRRDKFKFGPSLEGEDEPRISIL